MVVRRERWVDAVDVHAMHVKRALYEMDNAHQMAIYYDCTFKKSQQLTWITGIDVIALGDKDSLRVWKVSHLRLTTAGHQ